MRYAAPALLLLAWIASAPGCAATERFSLLAVRGIDRENFSTEFVSSGEPVRLANNGVLMLGWVTGVVPVFAEPIEKGLFLFGGPDNAHGDGVLLNNAETLANLAPGSNVYRDVTVRSVAWSVFLIGWASIDARGTPLHPSSGPLGLTEEADDETSMPGGPREGSGGSGWTGPAGRNP
jgi:hypothetical protein